MTWKIDNHHLKINIIYLFISQRPNNLNIY